MRRLLIPLVAVAAALSLRAQEAPLPVRPEQLPKAQPVAYTPPPILRETLPNGMRILLLPDHSLPLVKVYALVKAGGIYDPADQVGLAELAGVCLKAGGSEKYPADAMESTLESLAAEMASSAGRESTELSLNLLARDLDTGLPIFADVLMHPAFDAKKVAVEKAKMEEELRRQNEDPWAVGEREMAKVLYGAASPWARTSTVAGVQALTPEAMAAFHDRYFHPGAVILAAAGDFDPKALTEKLRALFGSWAEKKVDYPAVAAAPDKDAPKVVLMDKPDLTQTTVLVGELSGKRGEGASFNQDRYAMDVMNWILGGGEFASRLMREIRSNRGLAYSAGSDYSFGTDRGVYEAYCQTGVATTGEVCRLIREGFAQAEQAPPTEAEMELAKRSILNTFVFNYQNSGQIVRRAALFDFYGYPEDYLATYSERIRAVTPAQCQEVSRKYGRPETLSYFVLGPAAKVQEEMKAFGTPEVAALPQP